MEPKRLYRSRRNSMIAGVCGGLAEYLNMDPTVVRLIYAVSYTHLQFIPHDQHLFLKFSADGNPFIFPLQPGQVLLLSSRVNSIPSRGFL